MNKEHVSTLAGGGAGLWLLSTVDWTTVPFGESVKIVVALLLMLMGYLFYRGCKDGGSGPTAGAANV